MHDQPPKPKTNIYAVIFWALHVLCVVVVPVVLWLTISGYDAFSLSAAISGAVMVASAALRILDELQKRMESP